MMTAAVESYTKQAASQLTEINQKADLVAKQAAQEWDQNWSISQSLLMDAHQVSHEDFLQSFGMIATDSVVEITPTLSGFFDANICQTSGIWGGGVMVTSNWEGPTGDRYNGFAFRRSRHGSSFAHHIEKTAVVSAVTPVVVFPESMPCSAMLVVTLSTAEETHHYRYELKNCTPLDPQRCAVLWQDADMRFSKKPNQIFGTEKNSFVIVHADDTCRVLSSVPGATTSNMDANAPPRLLVIQLIPTSLSASQAVKLKTFEQSREVSRMSISPNVQCMLAKLRLQYSTV